MTTWPCLADTETVRLAIDEGALEADLVLSVDATNALVLTDAGLLAEPMLFPCARIYNTVSQNVATNTALTLATTRYAIGGVTVVGNTIVTNQAGLWVFGGSVSFQTGAAVGLAQALIGPTTVAVNYPDSETSYSAGANAALPETITLNPSNAMVLAAGVAIEMRVFHSFGGTIPTSTPLDAVGAEMWGALVRVYS